LPVPWRTLTVTEATVPLSSDAVPQIRCVQPAFQVALVYAPPAAGKVTVAVGGVRSMMKDRVRPPVLPLLSVATTVVM
jgi:hypothetical protein